MRDIYCIILYIFPDIHEDIGSRSRRTTFTEEVQRKHFITRRDLLNMKRKVCHLTATRHEDDAIISFKSCDKRSFSRLSHSRVATRGV